MQLTVAFSAFMPPENFALRPLLAFASGWPEASSPRNSTNGLAYRKLAEFVCVPQAQDATIWFRSAVISQAPGAGASVQADLTRCSCCPVLLLLLAVPAVVSDFVYC